MPMDWQNERYVRVYTRDTADLMAVGWEGRLVWYEMLRHCDRSGVIDTGGDLAPLAEMLRVPVDIFDVAVPRLTLRGMVTICDTAVLIPNFIEAQEAKQSDRQRQRESRARRRELALSARVVTKRDAIESQNVTECHDSSQDVTPSLAVPSLANSPLSPSRGRKKGPTKQQIEEAAALVMNKWNGYTGQHRRAGAWLEHVRKALAAGYTPLELCGAAWGCWRSCNSDDAVLANCTPQTFLRLKSREGKTCLPQWLEQAEIIWREEQHDQDYPWLEQLELS